MRNKKNLIIIIIILVMIFLTLNSCKKEQEENNINPNFISNGVIVENGILSFKSLKDFKNIINQLINNPDFAKQIKYPNFISLSNYSQNLFKRGSLEIIEEDTLFLSDVFAAVLNIEREIIVQGEVISGKA